MNESGKISIHGATIFRGHDRCGGTVTGAVPNGTGVFVDLAVNPDSFLHLAGWQVGPSGASPRYQDCIGTVRFRTSLKNGDFDKAGEIISATVDSDTSKFQSSSEQPSSAGNRCFDATVAEMPGALPKAFDRAALTHLVVSYKACLDKAQGNGAE